MQKKIISIEPQEKLSSEQNWLNLETIATVEMTSEDAHHPIEMALTSDEHTGWRASEAGKQMIRFVFNEPQEIKLIKLCFLELTQARTQEYVLRYSADQGQSSHEVVRQQWNFNPEGANTEIEEHQLDLQNVSLLELIIIPEISGGELRASLQTLLVA